MSRQRALELCDEAVKCAGSPMAIALTIDAVRELCWEPEKSKRDRVEEAIQLDRSGSKTTDETVDRIMEVFKS